MASDNLSSLSTSLLLAEDPGVGFIKHELDEWDVIAVEAGGFVPDVTLAKQTDDGDGVADDGACLLAPDADSDQAFAKFMNWERCHLDCLCIDRAVNGMTSFGSCGWGCVFVGFDIRASEEVIQLCGKISERRSFGLSEASVVGNHRRQNLNQLDEVDEVSRQEEIGELASVGCLANNIEAVAPAGLLAAQLPDGRGQRPRSDQHHRLRMRCCHLCLIHCGFHNVVCHSLGFTFRRKGGMESYHSLHTF